MIAKISKKIPALIAVILLGACSNMVSSNTVDTNLASVGATCASNTGAYHLPRRLIDVLLYTDASDPETEAGYDISLDEGRFVADASTMYCLDFLLSGFAEDRIGITRAGTLLTRVFTKAEDKSKEIATRLTQGAADLFASGLHGLPGDDRLSTFEAPKELAGKTIVRSFEFDPMDELATREVNASLRQFGYCLHLDGTSDPFVPEWALNVCDGRTGRYAPPQRSGLDILVDEPVSPEDQSRGVLYRPQLSHSMVILRQDAPGVPGARWHRSGSKRIHLPNAAPTFLLEVKRAIFVTAETDISFVNGMIESVMVKKPSELEAISNFTVEALQIVYNIPARALEIFQNRAENTEALILANQELILTLEEHNLARREAARDSAGADGPLPGGGDGRSSFTGTNPAGNAMAQCLANPAVRQFEDPRAYCEDAIRRNL